MHVCVHQFWTLVKMALFGTQSARSSIKHAPCSRHFHSLFHSLSDFPSHSISHSLSQSWELYLVLYLILYLYLSGSLSRLLSHSLSHSLSRSLEHYLLSNKRHSLSLRHVVFDSRKQQNAFFCSKNSLSIFCPKDSASIEWAPFSVFCQMSAILCSPLTKRKDWKIVIGIEIGLLNDQSVGFVFKWALYKETFFLK